MMTSRERVLTALSHQEADRVPCNLLLAWDYPSSQAGGLEFAENYASGGLGCKSADGVEFAEHLGHDIWYSTWWKEPPRPDGVPVTEWTPRPTQQFIDEVASGVRLMQQRGLAVCSAYSNGVFERAKDWLGYAQTLTAPYEDPRGFEITLDRITDWKCSIYGAYAAAGVDIVYIGDDLGTQRALVMSPAQYRDWYRPRHRRIVEHIRAIRPQVKIAFHSCGHITPLVPDLIEMGIDVLQAVQPEAMNIALLKREFGRDISFWGALGSQHVFNGTVQDVLDEVRTTLNVMAPGGGYIASPAHRLLANVGWENVLAFHEGVKRYGGYRQ